MPPLWWPCPGQHDFDSAAQGPCLSVRLRPRISFPPPPKGAVRPCPDRASATHLAVQSRPASRALPACNSVLLIQTALTIAAVYAGNLLNMPAPLSSQRAAFGRPAFGRPAVG